MFSIMFPVAMSILLFYTNFVGTFCCCRYFLLLSVIYTALIFHCLGVGSIPKSNLLSPCLLFSLFLMLYPLIVTCGLDLFVG